MYAQRWTSNSEKNKLFAALKEDGPLHTLHFIPWVISQMNVNR